MNDEQVTAERILVAVGGWPFVPELPGIEHAITSNEAFFLPELPKRVVVVGGGYIAVEFAGIFHGLGSDVTQVYRGPLFLRGFDDDVRNFLADEMMKKDLDIRFNTDIKSIEKQDSGLLVTFTDETTLESDCVMYATGRKPFTENLGLEACGEREV